MSRTARFRSLGIAALLGALLLWPGAGCNAGKNPPSGSPSRAAPTGGGKPAGPDNKDNKDNKPQHEPG